MLISASWTSPLFPYEYGYDSAWYTLMGRAVTKGFVPYRDYFDLKGPVFFFIEALGQIIKTGRTGIFILECIAGAVSSVFIIKICRLYLSKKGSFAVLFLYYLAYTSLLWGGNTCEEMMLPFSFACIYLILSMLKTLTESGRAQGHETAGTVLGLSFAIIFLSKPTLASFIVSGVILAGIFLIRTKNTGILVRFLLFFAAGACIVAVPVCAYFIFNGAFGDFIYSAFVFAFRRSTDYYETFSLDWEKNLCFCYAGFISSVLIIRFDPKGRYRSLFLLISSLLSWLLLHLGTPYTYYFINELPVWVMLLIEAGLLFDRIVQEFDKKRFCSFLAVFAFIILICARYINPAYDKLSENLVYFRYPENTYYEGCLDAYDAIPFYERDDIYDLESGMIWYEITGELPTNKYPVNLPYFLHLDPKIKSDVLEYLDKKKPKWIISEKMADFDDIDTREYVFGHYELFRTTSAMEIYRRVEY
ncbi:MAG: glycosyltransferase family 39 protein [Lachnospiraceae bacterium]|nr:glycosyltransferase family 39 protein [Lachnospiraceae bacterium]